ncbi:MAG: ABC transporter permease subunit, partial [Clostridia bacterium]|nr:ABC transporter permease subunit [Clostridia bacterium]
MSAVFKREFKAYFTSPIGYCVLAMMFGLTGFFFVLYNVQYASSNLTYVFQELQTYLLLLVLPILTMRLMSDDKRQKTDQVLLTSPVSLTGIVVGKYLAALLLYIIGLSMTLVGAVIIATQYNPDWMVIVGNYLGIILLGGLMIAIGLLISSLTESQFIAALGSFIAALVLSLLDSVKEIFASSTLVASVVDFLSVNQRSTSFAA